MEPLDQLLADQDGVIARRQVLDLNVKASEIARRLRRREWAQVHQGVYVNHTGPLTWQQRAWAAVLFSWPAALSHDSALRAGDGPGRRDRDEAIIHVAVERVRHLSEPDGVRLHRITRLDARVRWNRSPPRVRYEDAVLDVAADATSDLRAIAALADACGKRSTTAQRLLDALALRPTLARRRWLRDVLSDVASGTCSVLEHGYLTRVERAHGLPEGQRQTSHRHENATVYRDVRYAAFGAYVELDGRLFHATVRDRDKDMDRDLEAAASEDELTLRVSYGQVFDRGCATAGKIARVLQRRGWTGELQRCPDCGGSDSPDESDPPQT